MVCPYCSSKTQVTNSRSRAGGTEVWRRRECLSCKQIWTTNEHIDLASSHRIHTSENALEPFSREKLFVSIKDSLAHRKTALEDATALTDTVLAAVLRQKQANIQVSQLISIVHEVLQRFDPTAAAVYSAKHAKG